MAAQFCTANGFIQQISLSQQNASVSSQVLEQVLQQFTGEQEQIPPMYSAIKIGGKKLYELARAGKEVARTPRRITARPPVRKLPNQCIFAPV